MRKVFLALISVALFASSSRADIITFSGLTGSNGDTYTSYSENGYTVTATTGDWRKAFLFGNPVPDIFSASDVASVTITNASSLFTFNSADLGNANSIGAPTYSFQGFLGATQEFSSTGAMPTTAVFATFASPNTSAIIDRLVITINRGGTSSYNIDNINVSAAVPAPAGIILGGLGLVGMGGFSWIRRRKGLGQAA
jgi:hypothetical protein